VDSPSNSTHICMCAQGMRGALTHVYAVVKGVLSTGDAFMSMQKVRELCYISCLREVCLDLIYRERRTISPSSRWSDLPVISFSLSSEITPPSSSPSSSGTVIKDKWSCCGSEADDAMKCRPHIFRELMISIRAESSPPATINDDLDLTFFQTLEISVFPGCEYVIRVHITSEVVEKLHDYFSLKGMQDDEDVEPTAAAAIRTDTPVLLEDGFTRGGGGGGEQPQYNSSRQSSLPPPDPDGDSASKSKPKKQEALYIKYLRLGDINVEVSTVGFTFNVDKYQALINEFSLRNKVVDWHQLFWKFEKHAIVCVTSHTASTSINKVWEMMFGKQGRGGARPAADAAAKKALLLGEPF
jgi:hypothetical protein